VFGAACRPRPPNRKLVSIALLRRDLKASVLYGCENRFGNAMYLLHIVEVLLLRRTLLALRLKPALSNRCGNNGRQLEVVSHAPPNNFDRLTPVDFYNKGGRKTSEISAERFRQRRCGGGFDAQPLSVFEVCPTVDWWVVL
jgi:hypothetical protein